MKKKTYILFNKPFGVLSQFTGEEGQRTLAEFNFPKGVYAAGRLDKDSEGLLLLSDDGPFIEKLLNPKNAHPRTYLVQVENIPSNEALEKLRRGVQIKGHKTRPCEVELLESEPILWERNPPIRERKSIPTAWLCITLTEGKNRQVRRMSAAIGHPTLRLVRVAISDAKLADLPSGKWVFLESAPTI